MPHLLHPETTIINDNQYEFNRSGQRKFQTFTKIHWFLLYAGFIIAPFEPTKNF